MTKAPDHAHHSTPGARPVSPRRSWGQWSALLALALGSVAAFVGWQVLYHPQGAAYRAALENVGSDCVTVRATPAIWALFAIGVGLSLMTVLTYIVFRVRRGRRLLPGAWFPMLIAVVLLFIQPMVFFLTFAPLYAGGSVEEHGLFWTTYCGLGPAG